MSTAAATKSISKKQKSDSATLSVGDKNAITSATTKKQKVAVDLDADPPMQKKCLTPHPVAKKAKPVGQVTPSSTVVSQKMTVREDHPAKKCANPVEDETDNETDPVMPAHPVKKVRGNKPKTLSCTGMYFMVHFLKPRIVDEIARIIY